MTPRGLTDWGRVVLIAARLLGALAAIGLGALEMGALR